MPEYAWMCLNKQDSEYNYGSKYPKILNMAKFWIWQGSQYASVTQCSEYARICLAWQSSKYISDFEYTSVLNLKQVHRVLNLPEHGWLCLNWTWIRLKMSEFTIINSTLNIWHTIHSAEYLLRDIQNRWKICDRELWKNNYSF